MKGKYIKGDIINIAILSFLYAAVIVCLVGFTNIYGSTMDWDSQHWIIPEYLRNRFYETGQLFPSFAFEAGGGQNIYYYAYYGLHSPFLYLSYLLPFVEMRDYIIGINIFSVFAAVWLFYIWIRGKYSQKVSFFTSVLFLTSSPLIFHSHRHIMFVDYIPYLILALIFVRRYFRKNGGIWPVIISSFMIVTTSFFFSVGCFLVIGIYACMLYLEGNEKIKLWDMIKKVFPVAGGLIVAAAMAGILLIPTFFALLSGRAASVSGDTGGFDWNILMPEIRADFIFFGPYSMGLSVFSFYAIVEAIIKKDKANRFLAVILSVICVFPVVVYLLNGGLYLDGKVLIPFLPLCMIITAELFRSLFLKDKVIKTVIIAGTVVNIALMFTGIGKYEKFVLYAETLIILIGFIVYYKRLLSYAVCIPVAVCSFITCLAVNLNDNMPVKDYKEEEIYNTVKAFVKEAIEEEESVYRFGNGFNKWRTANRIMSDGYCQTTIYSSTSNGYYKDFYLNQIRNEVSYRNNSGLTTSGNVLFNMYMGVKYYITESSYIPWGYKQIGKGHNIYLYQSDNVFPIGFSSSGVISTDKYNSLKYPYTAEALMKYSVTDMDKSVIQPEDSHIDTGIEEITLEYTVQGNTEGIEKTSDGYMVDLKKQTELSLELSSPLDGKLLFIQFDVNNDIGGKSEDVYVSVNDIKNKLTQKGWKYHNQNYSFEYVISLDEDIETLDITLSKGVYSISGIKCYTMDYTDIKEAIDNVDEFIINKSTTKGDIIEGDIDVTEDGWFHLSVPYDNGFTIFVDGKEVEYFHSDIDFIGFNIEEGKHHIKIKYTAPGFETGKIISIAGMSVFMVIAAAEFAVFIKRRRKNEI